MTVNDPLVEFVRAIGEADMARRSARPRFGTLAIDEAITRRLAPRPTGVKPCPRCRGEGRLGPSSRGWTDPEQEQDCGLCGGDGEVPAS